MKPSRTDTLLPAGTPRWVRCYDNGGESFDRYTVVFTGRYTHRTGEHVVLGMSAHPFHPQGFGQHMGYPYLIDAVGGEWPPAIGRKNHLGKRISFADLPEDCQRCVLQDYREVWNIPANKPTDVVIP